MNDTYIAEIAGKDSISSIINFGQTNKNITIVPTVVYTGTEYGDISTFTESIEFLNKLLCKYPIKFETTQIIHNEKLWNILNAKYQYLIYKKFDFFTPCIMCHFYTHLIRIPTYILYKASGIITGERVSHDGRVKLNQHPNTLKCFSYLFEKNGIQLIRPNCNMYDTKDVDEIIKDEYIITHANDVKCVLSGNLFGFPNQEDVFVFCLNNFLENFVKPVGDFCIHNFVQTGKVNLQQLEELMEGILNER